MYYRKVMFKYPEDYPEDRGLIFDFKLADDIDPDDVFDELEEINGDATPKEGYVLPPAVNDFRIWSDGGETILLEGEDYEVEIVF